MINDNVVREAIAKIKPDKRDCLYNAVSDQYRNGPDELIHHLTKLIRAFLVHGSVPESVLLCILTPIVKCNLDDVTSSKNYRAIAGCCQLLKVIDQVFLLLERDKLSFDPLQYAYQSESSTTLCT